MPAKYGFSLFEKLIVLCILSVIMLLAIPFTNIINTNRLQASADKIHHFLNYARNYALTYKTSVICTIKNNNIELFSKQNEAILLKSLQLDNKIKLKSNDNLIFYPNGGIIMGQTITIGYNDKDSKIILFKTGRIRQIKS